MSSEEDRAAAFRELRRMPRDASATRIRDAVDGRPRAQGAFGLSRLRLREPAHRGDLPGVSRSNW